MTILYYTSNRENPAFEQRVRDNIIQTCCDLSIISVSQKPIDFGTNICVGDVGTSGFNMFRQVQIGLREVKTDFVISAEADCMYPQDYFTFVPPKLDVAYRDSNLYVMGRHRDYFYYKPEGATHAQAVGTKYYLDVLTKLFEGEPMWDTNQKNFPKEKFHNKFEDVFEKVEYWKSPNPVVQIKTKDSMRHYTHSERIPIYNLDYWGDSKQFFKTYV
jgi:hypothetical protein